MKFTIPANAPAKPFHKHWQFCVGSGHAAMAMRTDYCEQLKQIHDELGIERVRFHGIFSDDMHTYDTMSTVMPMPGSEQVPFYENSFRLPGLVYDNVLKAGMKPFVELSFMPSPMAKRPTRGTFYWKPCIAPPKDEAQWQAYIQKFVRFLLNRYGKEEVETWFFEVWNEPDLKTPFFDGTQEDYFRLYEITAKAVKAVDDKLKVGGPATSNSKWVAAFVDYCKAHDAPVDFITTHQYAGDAVWDSGTVASAQSILNEYLGPNLAPRTEYTWSVTVTDDHGETAEGTSRFETGLLNGSAFEGKAQWITHAPDKASPVSPVLYKDFVVQGNVKKARLYATALGVYEAEINGEPVDDTYFHPGWTNYRKRLQYQTCAVTLHSGKNRVALTLANGWYKGKLGFMPQPNHYGDTTAALAALCITYEDGHEEWLGTDGS